MEKITIMPITAPATKHTLKVFFFFNCSSINLFTPDSRFLCQFQLLLFRRMHKRCLPSIQCRINFYCLIFDLLFHKFISNCNLIIFPEMMRVNPAKKRGKIQLNTRKFNYKTPPFGRDFIFLRFNECLYRYRYNWLNCFRTDNTVDSSWTKIRFSYNNHQ